MKRTVPEYRKPKWLTRRGYKKLENRSVRDDGVSRFVTKVFSFRLRQLFAQGRRYLLVSKGWNMNSHKG